MAIGASREIIRGPQQPAHPTLVGGMAGQAILFAGRMRRPAVVALELQIFVTRETQSIPARLEQLGRGRPMILVASLAIALQIRRMRRDRFLRGCAVTARIGACFMMETVDIGPDRVQRQHGEPN